MTDEPAVERPDYGPSGYLPPRAAARARKIILREPMGLHWAVAAVVVGVLVLAAGGIALVVRAGPPGPPFVDAGPLEAVDARGVGTAVADDHRVLVVRGAGGVAVFRDPPGEVRWCTGPPRLVASDGSAAWRPDGRLVAGTGSSLARLPARVHDGTLYVDPSVEGTRLAPTPGGAPERCPG
jgi:hypothetical protein